jgi:alpha-tubulin suppressor-like RCC1 family protein
MRRLFIAFQLAVTCAGCGEAAGTTAGQGIDGGALLFLDAAGCGAAGQTCCSVSVAQDFTFGAVVTGLSCSEGLACVAGVCAEQGGVDGAPVDATTKGAGDGASNTGSDGASKAPDAGFEVPSPPPDASVLAVAAGIDHACALLAGGAVTCWGANSYGQLGDGTDIGPGACASDSCSTTPVAVPGLSSGVVAISASLWDTCALRSDGTVACWGDNASGQVGSDGSQGPQICSSFESCATSPVTVPGVAGATAIAVGGLEACAVLADGTAKCWGGDVYGELGNGMASSSVATAPVVVSHLSGAVAISVGGESFACALLSDGSVACWGGDALGELGNDSTVDSPTPVPVSGLHDAIAISAGESHACALLSDGTIACWGDNSTGALGLPTSGPSTDDGGGAASVLTPELVPGVSGAIAISAGVEYTCAVLAGGSVACWGANQYGQLGDGNTTDSSTPVVIAGLSGVTGISANRNTCAVSSYRSIACWGDNFVGSLGAGTATGPDTCAGDEPCSTSPVTVQGL